LKTPVDSRLLSEAARFDLRFACDDCVHFDAERAPTCAHGWPIRLRRSALDAERTSDAEREPVAFCKEFELS
jgi:hypothetical protein